MNLKIFGYSMFLIAASAQDEESKFLGETRNDNDCKEVTTVENFDIEQYASAPWYIHQQAETRYSPLDQNYCTRAQYNLQDKTIWGYSVSVNNKAQDAEGNDFGGELCAYQDKETASKLAVAPCFLPKFFAGPYWVVAYDEAEGYALISGGQPNIVGEDGGCRTGTGINRSGLWIFSRSQDRNDDLIEKVRTIAVDAGFDISVLNDVVQEGCVYEECADQEETFKVWYGAQKDCDWVDSWRSVRCFLYGDKCPETCGRCPA